MNRPSDKPLTASAEQHAETVSNPTVIASGELLGQQGELLIEHDDQLYQLRRTRADKLILTKVSESNS